MIMGTNWDSGCIGIDNSGSFRRSTASSAGGIGICLLFDGLIEFDSAKTGIWGQTKELQETEIKISVSSIGVELVKEEVEVLALGPKVRFKRLDLTFLEIGALRVVFTKRDPEFPGISGQVV
eukprot:sb/3476021/